MRSSLALVLVLLVVGCGRGRNGAVATDPVGSTPTPEPAAEPSAVASGSAAALDAGPAVAPITTFFESLPVAGHPDAFVSLPTGAASKRPVVVVIHGAGDRPDWQCGGWRRATGAYPFIVCPTGRLDPGNSTKGDTRYTHVGGKALLSVIDGALEALTARYPDHADTSTPILAGFSLGSGEILALAVQQPARFPRIVLVEGVNDGFDDGRARAFVGGGGLRVLFGCGQRGCEIASKATAQRLQARDHLDARVVFAPVDHTFNPPLEDAVHSQLAWLVEGDARWEIVDAGG
jgi:pimeloyl-ACP methyl ester carboxylesterase